MYAKFHNRRQILLKVYILIYFEPCFSNSPATPLSLHYIFGVFIYDTFFKSNIFKWKRCFLFTFSCFQWIKGLLVEWRTLHDNDVVYIYSINLLLTILRFLKLNKDLKLKHISFEMYTVVLIFYNFISTLRISYEFEFKTNKPCEPRKNFCKVFITFFLNNFCGNRIWDF